MNGSINHFFLGHVDRSQVTLRIRDLVSFRVTPLNAFYSCISSYTTFFFEKITLVILTLNS
jgi:hypothetical protein